MNGAAAKLSAAHDYTALGWQAFVLSPSKTPVANCRACHKDHLLPAQKEACKCLTCHGFYAATGDMGRLEEMLRTHPAGLLAIRTGAPSGIAVIDVDPPDGFPTMRQHIADGLLPRTVIQRTGSGGCHLIYRHPGTRLRSGAGKGGPGIDVKADGGYIVVSPSIHPRTGRPYEWATPLSADLAPLPQEWTRRLREPESPARMNPAAPVTVTGHGYAAAALRAEIAILTAATRGHRNDQLNRSAFALGQLAGSGDLTENEVTAALMNAATAIGLVNDDGIGPVRRTIASGLTAGIAQPRTRRAA